MARGLNRLLPKEIRSRQGLISEESGVADPDTGSGAFLSLDLGSGIGKKSRSESGIRIRDEHPRSYFRELRNFLG
jgi:hypothetical protein